MPPPWPRWGQIPLLWKGRCNNCRSPSLSDFSSGAFFLVALASSSKCGEDTLIANIKVTHPNPGYKGRWENNYFLSFILTSIDLYKAGNSSNTEVCWKMPDGQKEQEGFTWQSDLPGTIRSEVLIGLHKSKELTGPETQNGQT